MFFKLAVLFILVPLVELAILIYLGTIIGVLETIIIVVVTGLLGAFLARRQGLIALYNIRSSLQDGILPADQMLHGALIFTGGLVFITPGLLTDIAGIGLLIPAARRMIIRWLKKMLERKIQQGNVQYYRIR